MGKKINHKAVVASAKTSKNEKQLHSLIKAMRPKVYITDSSSFKQLVQELTGYQSQTTARTEDIKKVNVVPVIEIEDQEEIIIPAANTTLSTDSSFYSLGSSYDQAFDQLIEINQQSGLMQSTSDDGISTFDNQLSDFSKNQQTDWLAYQNLESWLLDADQPYYTQHEQEISLFDYDLSWLI